MLWPLKSPQRQMRQLDFRVDGTGTAEIDYGSRDATLTDNGTGDYTLTFDRAFAQVPVVVGTVLAAAEATLTIVSVTTKLVNVAIDDDAGTRVDAKFHLSVRGSDVPLEH